MLDKPTTLVSSSVMTILNSRRNRRKRKLVLKIGPNACGKGTEGNALKFLHSQRVETFTMRRVIADKSRRCPDFAAIANQCEQTGQLIPFNHVRALFEEIPSMISSSCPVLWFDGVPRHSDQVEIVADAFSDFDIIVHESRASDSYLLRVFLATLDSEDRQGRQDACEEIHHSRVALYRRNLPSIVKAIKRRGWQHEVYDAERSIHARVKDLLRVIQLPLDGAKLQGLESALKLKKLPPLEHLLEKIVA